VSKGSGDLIVLQAPRLAQEAVMADNTALVEQAYEALREETSLPCSPCSTTDSSGRRRRLGLPDGTSVHRAAEVVDRLLQRFSSDMTDFRITINRIEDPSQDPDFAVEYARKIDILHTRCPCATLA
jgi:hypothetical protein